jgi:hypothetical protein
MMSDGVLQDSGVGPEAQGFLCYKDKLPKESREVNTREKNERIKQTSEDERSYSKTPRETSQKESFLACTSWVKLHRTFPHTWKLLGNI